MPEPDRGARATADASTSPSAPPPAPSPTPAHATADSALPPLVPIARNLAEVAALCAWWGLLLWLHRTARVTLPTLGVLVVIGCWVKTLLFSVEHVRQLVAAARANLAHHRFLILMGVNIAQMALSFAFDFHALWSAKPDSFSGIAAGTPSGEALFDLFYLSVLNFTFFGFGDIVPQTIPGRVVNLTEVVIAFAVVIFLLSDFMSLKESVRGER
jgi:hypothetical protein